MKKTKSRPATAFPTIQTTIMMTTRLLAMKNIPTEENRTDAATTMSANRETTVVKIIRTETAEETETTAIKRMGTMTETLVKTAIFLPMMMLIMKISAFRLKTAAPRSAMIKNKISVRKAAKTTVPRTASRLIRHLRLSAKRVMRLSAA